jgi:ADP-ribosylglycohydrolase
MKKNNFEAFILASYLDTIGYLNGFMEFNKMLSTDNFIESPSIQHYNNIFNFFKIGGFNLDLKFYKASDDTILNIANIKVLTKNKFTIYDFIDKYLEYDDTLINGDRGTGKQIITSLKNLKKVKNPNIIEYDNNVLGNGAVMRSCVFGFKYNYKKDLNLLYKWVIDTSKLTHNNIEAYIPALIVAIFSSMSIEKIPPIYWLFELDNIKNNIKFNNKKEIDFFNKLLENLEIIYNNSIIFNSSQGYDYYKYRKPLYQYDILFEVINLERIQDDNLHNIGSISEDLLYISFYNIINCFTINNETARKLKETKITIDELTPNFIYLVLNSSLSYGDSDTIGFVSGFWYGALFGFKDVPNINFKDLEFYQEIKNITDSL